MADAETLRKFRFERVLNEDPTRKSIILLGQVDGQPAIIRADKTAFDTNESFLVQFAEPAHLCLVSLTDKNDVYHWFLASTPAGDLLQQWDVKVELIYPATEKHIRKYSRQKSKMVLETPEIYREKVLPIIERNKQDGRLNWVYNILEHKKEADSIILEDFDPETGFILLPDSKWDRKTMSSLYTMAVVHRKDLASLRDLKKKHVPWLKSLQKKIILGLCDAFPEVEEDELRIYVHYQPSYYHFHVHVVAIEHDAGFGQAAGKAWLLSNVISQLETMAGDDEAGFADIDLTYSIGEQHELWQNVFTKKGC